MNEALICIGSNENGENNLRTCRGLLTDDFKDIIYSNTCITSPIGSNYTKDFINQLVIIRTEKDKELVLDILKAIEKDLGRSATDKTNGLVKIDVDLVVWNAEILKPEDILHNYMRNLIPSLPLQEYHKLVIS